MIPLCYKINNYTLDTTGEVPITLKLSISAFRNQAGLWAFEQVRLIANPVLWFVDDQGYDAELIRPDFSHTWPREVVEERAKKLLQSEDRWPDVCRLLNEEEEAGRFHVIC